MKVINLRTILPILLVLGAMTLSVLPASAGAVSQDDDDLVARGEYLANIAGCVGCHTPVSAETFQPLPDMEFAGGVPFEVPGVGTLLTRNITQDEETGIGVWTDEEIKTAIQTGVTPDGQYLFPIMPYITFNNMAESDLDALVAFLRTIEPIENPIPRQQLLPDEAYPQLPRRTDIEAPDPSDTAARGRYLMTGVTACTDCHTPIDAETGAPVMDQYLAGSQPYIGPWGTVYGGNITPDEETGIGGWTDEELERVIRHGVRPDGRIAVLMPWVEYAHLTDQDVAAIIHYLRNDVAPVHAEVPAAALEPAFVRMVDVVPTLESTDERPAEQPEEQPEEAQDAGEDAAPERPQPGINPVWLGAGVVGVGVLVVALLALRRGSGPAAG